MNFSEVLHEFDSKLNEIKTNYENMKITTYFNLKTEKDILPFLEFKKRQAMSKLSVALLFKEYLYKLCDMIQKNKEELVLIELDAKKIKHSNFVNFLFKNAVNIEEEENDTCDCDKFEGMIDDFVN